MNIVVCVKHVPDAQSERTFQDSDSTVDRAGVDGLLSELDEYAVEEALKIVEAAGRGRGHGAHHRPRRSRRRDQEVPADGRRQGVHVLDDAIHGSDAVATSLILAEAVKKATDGAPELVLTGMASTDGVMGVVPAMLAERLGLPQVTYASELTVGDGTVTIRRDGDTASETIEATLPALVSVTDQINEPRYPSFKGIMAAKKKPVETWSAGRPRRRRLPGRPGRGVDLVVSFAQRPAAPAGPDRHRRGRWRHQARRVPRRRRSSSEPLTNPDS